MYDQLGVSYETVISFFESTEGNYRNALYLECNNCHYQRESSCGDFLFIPGYDCRPILLPIQDAKILIGSTLDKTDCSGILPTKAFLSLYQKWIELCTISDDICPILQLLAYMNGPNRKTEEKF